MQFQHCDNFRLYPRVRRVQQLFRTCALSECTISDHQNNIMSTNRRIICCPLSVILYLCVVTTLGQTTPEQCKHNKAKPSVFLTEGLGNTANIRCGRSIHLMCGQVKGISIIARP